MLFTKLYKLILYSPIYLISKYVLGVERTYATVESAAESNITLKK